MSNTYREVESLLVDYADALRDGTIPMFLKSLSRDEARLVCQSQDFLKALEAARLLNETHFADQAVHPDIGLFISRVNAEITTRIKKAQAVPRTQNRRIRATR